MGLVVGLRSFPLTNHLFVVIHVRASSFKKINTMVQRVFDSTLAGDGWCDMNYVTSRIELLLR